MAKTRLITTSLIGAIDWAKNAPPGKWRDKAYADLSNTLNRVWTGSEAAERGIKFENKVYEIVDKAMKSNERYTIPGTNEFQLVVNKCMGGTFQDKLKSIEVIGGETYCLYGKTDVLFERQIIDIKTTAEFKREKYENSFQHILYMYISGREFFEYVIAEWANFPLIKDVYCITIHQENPKITLADTIHNTVLDAIQWLEARPVLWKAYNEKFCMY